MFLVWKIFNFLNFYFFILLMQATRKEIEKHQVHLKSIRDLGENLKTVLKGKESLVEDKLSLLNSNWIAVTSRAEEWFSLLLVRKMRLFTWRKCWCPVVGAQPYRSARSGALDYTY